MDGFAADHAGDFFAIAIEDLDALAEHDLIPPAADGDELDETVRSDVLDEETDFVHVAGDDDARAFVGVGAGDRAGFIGGEWADFSKLVDENRADFIFEAGDRVGVGKFLEKGKGFGAHNCMVVGNSEF